MNSKNSTSRLQSSFQHLDMLDTKIHKCSERIERIKTQNFDPNSNSIIREIQEIENRYMLKIKELQDQNFKLFQAVNSLTKTIEEMKQVIYDKSMLVKKQQIQIIQLKQKLDTFDLQQTTRFIKSEIEEEKSKTERLRTEFEAAKKQISKSNYQQLFKRIETVQDSQQQQNKYFINCVLHLVDKPRSQSQYLPKKKN